MMDFLAGNSKAIKMHNRALVLDTIRRNGSISRIEISRQTLLTPTAVSDIIRQLASMKLIREKGEDISTGGRKPILLELNSDACYAIGIDIDEHKATGIILNLAAETVHVSSLDIGDKDEDKVIGVIINLIEDMVQGYGITMDKVLGIGLGVPGMVDKKTGRVLYAPNLGWKNFPIIDKLKNSFKVPMLLENEAWATGIAEYWVGLARQWENFVCINIRTGVGSGIFINGSIYTGARGTAGEVGHSTVANDGPLCSCGNRGCLESMVSTPALVKRYEERLNLGQGSTLQEIISSYGKGNRAVKDVLEETGVYIGIGIANIINILNPSSIILGGDITTYGHIILDTIKDTVRKRALDVPASNTEIFISQLGLLGPAIGAGAIVLKNAFSFSDEIIQFKKVL
ncbi:MAG: ROK family transcriptional regulator [Mahellales bacterium]|jgi:N-acetylglucosamine repressor